MARASYAAHLGSRSGSLLTRHIAWPALHPDLPSAHADGATCSMTH